MKEKCLCGWIGVTGRFGQCRDCGGFDLEYVPENKDDIELLRMIKKDQEIMLTALRNSHVNGLYGTSTYLPELQEPIQ